MLASKSKRLDGEGSTRKLSQDKHKGRAAIYRSVKSAAAFTPEQKGISCCPKCDYGKPGMYAGRKIHINIRALFSAILE